jgi:hypothetical protein
MAKRGRPTDYLPEFCERIIELGKQGMAVVEMANALEVCKSSLYDWSELHPEFATAFKRAKEASEVATFKKFDMWIKDREVNSALAIFTACNRFPHWRRQDPKAGEAEAQQAQVKPGFEVQKDSTD